MMIFQQKLIRVSPSRNTNFIEPRFRVPNSVPKTDLELSRGRLQGFDCRRTCDTFRTSVPNGHSAALDSSLGMLRAPIVCKRDSTLHSHIFSQANLYCP